MPTLQKSVTLSLRLFLLTFLLFFCFTLGSMVAAPQAPSQPASSDQGAAAAILLLVCFLDVCVLSFIILRSSWHGWRLISAIWLAFYATAFFLPQIELLVFSTPLPVAMLPRLLLMGVIVTALFAPLAVWILGKRKPSAAEAMFSAPSLPASVLAMRLAIIAGIYVCVYFTFGYFVAWQDPAVRAYYGGNDPGSFFAQMGNVVSNRPGLIAFQILRGVLWGLVALPIVRMMKGTRWKTGLAVALLFSVVLSDKLLLPNPYMPQAVRMTHLLETASSNFLFGWLVVWVLSRRRAGAGTSIAAGSS